MHQVAGPLARAIVTPSLRPVTFRAMPNVPRHSRLLAVLLLALVVALGVAGEWLIERQKTAELRGDLQNRLAQAQERLAGTLYAHIQLVRGLVAVVHLEPQLDQKRFEMAARPLLEGGGSYLRNIAAAPDLVIRYMVPMAGNERAVGRAYRDLPGQFASVEHARLSRQMVMAGPVKLVQGGVGLIVRVPIYLPDDDGQGEHFWGIVSAVIESDRLLASVGLPDGDPSMEVAIRGRDGLGARGEVFLGRPEVFGQSPVLSTLELPGGSWQLAAIPRGGWPATAPGTWPLRGVMLGAVLTVLWLFWAQTRLVRASALADERQRSAVRQMTSMLEAAPDATLLVDGQGTIVRANLEAGRLFKTGADPLEGVAIGQLLPGLSANWQEGNQRLEGEAQARDGSRFPVELSLAPVQTMAGAYTGCAVRDVTARRRADEELRMHREELERLVDARTRELSLAKEAAEAANVAKGHFLANVSHEIRTPINAVVGLLHLIRRAGVPPAQAARMDAVEAASAHLLHIINTLLDLAKIDAGKLEPASTPIDLAALLNEVREIMGGRAELKGLALQTWPPEPLPALLGDATLIRQCLLNYVSNAIKFTEHGRVAIRVHRVTTEPGALTLCFEVEDSGMGLDAATQARLFQPFEQADSSSTRQHGGTGLGLVLTRRMAMLMGGDAGVRSAGPGQGSVFWFTARLALDTGAAHRTAHGGAEASPAQLPARFAGLRVLLADDEPVNRLIAQTLLEEAGLRVTTATDGGEAVAAARQTPFAIILMDLQMPHMDGLAATAAIRQLSGYAQTPILALTANAFPEDRARCLAAGMNDFLAKPFGPAELVAMMERWVPEGVGCAAKE